MVGVALALLAHLCMVHISGRRWEAVNGDVAQAIHDHQEASP